MHNKQVRSTPLLVRNEGVLVETDLLWESFYLLLKRNPFVLIWLPYWLFRGTAFTAQQIMDRVMPSVEYLPYNRQLIGYLQEQHRNGRELVLVTSLSKEYAQRISCHLGFFKSVLSREELLSTVDPKKSKNDLPDSAPVDFVYVCREVEDINLCGNGNVVLVNPDQSTLYTIRNQCNIEQVIVSSKGGLFKYIQAIRVHQWLKNLLVFVPLITAHQIDDPILVLRTILAFFAFSLCASGVYLLNDLIDISDDRKHQKKCKRPFAAATISVKTGTLLIPVFTLSAFGFGLVLGTPFLYILAGYLATTIFYSIWLKKLALVDVITLAFLYTTRIFAGGSAVSIMPSFWLLSFSMFIFFSLALTKRGSELLHAHDLERTKLDGRGYVIDDIKIVYDFGVASGYMSVLVLALYINSDSVRLLYGRPQVIWLMCPMLLYWISRVWLITSRGQMHDDPLIFTVQDRVSQGIAVLGLFILWFAT